MHNDSRWNYNFLVFCIIFLVHLQVISFTNFEIFLLLHTFCIHDMGQHW